MDILTRIDIVTDNHILIVNEKFLRPDTSEEYDNISCIHRNNVTLDSLSFSSSKIEGQVCRFSHKTKQVVLSNRNQDKRYWWNGQQNDPYSMQQTYFDWLNQNI
jgi:hypothetical protein